MFVRTHHTQPEQWHQGNDFELILTVIMERGHSVQGSLSREFSSIYIVREFWPSEFGIRCRVYDKFWFLEKNDPLRGNFQKSVPKGFIATQIHVLCANFVKFGRPEIGEIARRVAYPTKSKILARCPAPACARIAPTICRDQRRTMFAECPKYHPNRFTPGGVIA